MYASWFQYNITKPYPFRWFTPVVVIGGIVLTAVFTFLTIATSGYVLQPYHTTTPNVTLDQQYWFTKAPFAWRGSLAPTCESRELTIGSQFLTSNLGLLYQLTSVTKVNTSANPTSSSLGSIPYLNQILQDCTIVKIQMNIRKVDYSRDQSEAWWSWIGGSVDTTASCTIATDDGDLVATFTTTYIYDDWDFSYIIQNDYLNKTSMWWGTRLLAAYYFSTLVALSTMPSWDDSVNGTSDARWMFAMIEFATNQPEDITSYNIFSLIYYVIASTGNIILTQTPMSSMYNNPGLATSPALTEALSFARVMYSMILVDLGQADFSNLLLNNTLLEWAAAHPDDGFRNDPTNILNCSNPNCYGDYDKFNTIAGPYNLDNTNPGQGVNWANAPPPLFRYNLSDAYEKLKPPLSGPGALGTRPATIFNQYSCSVPVQRDGGAIFLAVLVAILVYLRAAFSLLNTIVKPIVVKKDPKGANICCTPADSPETLPSSNFSANDRYVRPNIQQHNQTLAYEPMISYNSYPNGWNNSTDYYNPMPTPRTDYATNPLPTPRNDYAMNPLLTPKGYAYERVQQR